MCSTQKNANWQIFKVLYIHIHVFHCVSKAFSTTQSFFIKVGLSRSTTGCVSACLFREFQLSASYEGLIETVPGINLEVLRMDKYEIEKEKDALFRGEFEVVKELVAALADGDVSLITLSNKRIVTNYQFFRKTLTKVQ